MRPAILVSRDRQGDWSDWRPVRVVSEDDLTWRIWSWRNPFSKLVHKRSLGLRVQYRAVSRVRVSWCACGCGRKIPSGRNWDGMHGPGEPVQPIPGETK